VFSQNGEDGIVEYLLALIHEPTYYFLEIGASDGLENNCAYLALVKKYCGMMVEADPVKSRLAQRFLAPFNLGVDYVPMLVTPSSVPGLLTRCLQSSPDFFSLDIDGLDYYVARSVIAGGFRPKVVCVEYNSAFGPDQAVTIPYDLSFEYRAAHRTGLYYGVSIKSWRLVFERLNYQFVTVDRNGVNAFFVDPAQVDMGPLAAVRGSAFRENYVQRMRFRCNWEGQFAFIRTMPYLTIT
jgi:hypothetical protein